MRSRARFVTMVVIVFAMAFVSLRARADVGPPPTCAPGTHSQYLMGHRCVAEGSHLELDDGGAVRTVPDAPPLRTGSSAPPVASSRVAASKSTCALAARGAFGSDVSSDGGVGWGMLAVAVAVVAGRRARRAAA